MTQHARQGAAGWLARLLAILSILFLHGCNSALPVLRPDTPEGPIAYMMSVRQNTSTALDKVMVRLDTAQKSETPDYRTWSNWWCPRYPNAMNARDLVGLIQSYCQAHGGIYEQRRACITTTEPRAVLFHASLYKTSGCEGNYETVGSLVIEPRPGREHSPGYLDALRRAGYVPTYIQVAQSANARAAEAERIRREMPLLTKRGTRICKVSGMFEYYGFVEDVLPDQSKIKISVTGTTSGLVPGGWQPQTLWAPPETWRVCE